MSNYDRRQIACFDELAKLPPFTGTDFRSWCNAREHANECDWRMVGEYYHNGDGVRPARVALIQDFLASQKHLLLVDIDETYSGVVFILSPLGRPHESCRIGDYVNPK